MGDYEYHEKPLYEFYVGKNGGIESNVYHNYRETIEHGAFRKQVIWFMKGKNEAVTDSCGMDHYVYGYLYTFNGSIENAKEVITRTLHDMAERAEREYKRYTDLLDKVENGPQVMEVMEKPYTIEEMKEKQDEDGFVAGCVAVPLSDLIGFDLERFLFLLARKLVDDETLMNVSYELVGTKGSDLLIKVVGDVTEILEQGEL